MVWAQYAWLSILDAERRRSLQGKHSPCEMNHDSKRRRIMRFSYSVTAAKYNGCQRNHAKSRRIRGFLYSVTAAKYNGCQRNHAKNRRIRGFLYSVTAMKAHRKGGGGGGGGGRGRGGGSKRVFCSHDPVGETYQNGLLACMTRWRQKCDIRRY